MPLRWRTYVKLVKAEFRWGCGVFLLFSCDLSKLIGKAIPCCFKGFILFYFSLSFASSCHCLGWESFDRQVFYSQAFYCIKLGTWSKSVNRIGQCGSCRFCRYFSCKSFAGDSWFERVSKSRQALEFWHRFRSLGSEIECFSQVHDKPRLRY